MEPLITKEESRDKMNAISCRIHNNFNCNYGNVCNQIMTQHKKKFNTSADALINASADGNRSIFDILSLKVYLTKEVCFMFCWEINLSQMQFYFPLINNSNSHTKTGLFFSFVSLTSQLSDIIHSQTIVMNFVLSVIVIQKLRFN